MAYTPPDKNSVDFELSSTQPITNLQSVDFDVTEGAEGPLTQTDASTLTATEGISISRRSRTDIVASLETPVETTPLGSPNNLQTSVEKTDVTVSWDRGSTKNTHAFVYRDGTLVGATREPDSQYTDYNLAESTQYSYTVSNAILSVSSPSNAASNASDSVTRYWGTDWGTLYWSDEDPNTLSVSVSGGYNQLSWQSETRDEDGYLVYRSTDPDAPYSEYEVVGATTSQSYTDRSVQAESGTYYYRVTDYTITEESEIVGPETATTEKTTVTIDNAVTPANGYVFQTASNGLALDGLISGMSAETLQIIVSSRVSEQGLTGMQSDQLLSQPFASAQDGASPQIATANIKDATGSIDTAKALTSVNLESQKAGTLTASGTITTAGDPGRVTDLFTTAVTADDIVSAIEEGITQFTASPRLSSELTDALDPATISAINAATRTSTDTTSAADTPTVTGATAVVSSAQDNTSASSVGLTSAVSSVSTSTEHTEAISAGTSGASVSPLTVESITGRTDVASVTSATTPTLTTVSMGHSNDDATIIAGSADPMAADGESDASDSGAILINGEPSVIDAESLSEDVAGLSSAEFDTFSTETVGNDDPGTLTQVTAGTLQSTEDSSSSTEGIQITNASPIAADSATISADAPIVEPISASMQTPSGTSTVGATADLISANMSSQQTPVSITTRSSRVSASASVLDALSDGRVSDQDIVSMFADTQQTDAESGVDESGTTPISSAIFSPTSSTLAQEQTVVQTITALIQDATGSIDTAKALTSVSLESQRAGTLTASGTITTVGDPGRDVNILASLVQTQDIVGTDESGFSTAITSTTTSPSLATSLDPAVLSAISASISEPTGDALTTDDATVASAVAVVDDTEAITARSESGIVGADGSGIVASDAGISSDDSNTVAASSDVLGESSVALAADSGVTALLGTPTTPTTFTIENVAEGPLSALTAMPVSADGVTSAFEPATLSVATSSSQTTTDDGGATDGGTLTDSSVTTISSSESVVEGTVVQQATATPQTAIDVGISTDDDMVEPAAVTPVIGPTTGRAVDQTVSDTSVVSVQTADGESIAADDSTRTAMTTSIRTVNATAAMLDEDSLLTASASPVVTNQGITTLSDITTAKFVAGTTSLMTGGAGVSIAYDGGRDVDIQSSVIEADETAILDVGKSVSGPAEFSINTIDADTTAIEEGELTKAFMSRLIDSEGVKNAGSSPETFSGLTRQTNVGIALGGERNGKMSVLTSDEMVAIAAELSTGTVDVLQVDEDAYLVGVGYSYPVFPRNSTRRTESLSGDANRTVLLDDEVTSVENMSEGFNSVENISDNNDVTKL